MNSEDSLQPTGERSRRRFLRDASLGVAGVAVGATARKSTNPKLTSSPPRWTTSPSASSTTHRAKCRAKKGLRDIRILMSVYESIKTGKAVKLA